MADEQRRMRPEANSVWLDELTNDQQRAIKVLINLLDAALKDLPRKAEWERDRDPEVNTEQRERSRLMLLGGGRGSGKSTVANTLRAALNTGDYFNKRLDTANTVDMTEDERRIHLDRLALAEQIDRISNQIIVLEPLSMEAAPSETNILAALLARIEELLFPKLTHEDVPSTSGENKRHRAVLDLLRLQTDVALAWNGNLSDRKGRLDPDNYAMEELRVERVRLQLRDRFGQVLRHTARDSLGCERPTMFLLIVDDADVSPGQVMDLVERLRMVGVPELAVLLVGSVETIELVFRMNFAQRFRFAGGHVDAAEIGLDQAEFASLTNSLARSSLRKHIPYHQRVQLQPLLARHALKLQPLQMRDERAHAAARNESDVADLEAMLGKVFVGYPATPTIPPPWQAAQRHRLSLAEFVYPQSHQRAGQETVHGAEDSGEERSWYVGSRVLADSPRVVVDLWNTLRDATSDELNKIQKDPWAESQLVREPGATRLDVRLHLLFRQLASERLDAKTDIWDGSTPIDSAIRECILRDGNLSALGLSVRHPMKRDEGKSLPLHDGRKLYWSGHNGLEFEFGEPTGESGRTTKRTKTKQEKKKEKKREKKEKEKEKTPASRREVGPLVLVEDLWSLEYRTAAENSTAWNSLANLHWVVECAPASSSDDATERKPASSSDDAKERKPASSSDDAKERKQQRRWRTPRYRTVRQIEQFGDGWRGFVEHLDGRRADEKRPADTLRDLVDGWVTLHTETLLGMEPEPFTGQEDRVTRARWLVELMRNAPLSLGRGNSRRPDEWVSRIVKDWLKEVDRLEELVGDQEAG